MALLIYALFGSEVVIFISGFLHFTDNNSKSIKSMNEW